MFNSSNIDYLSAKARRQEDIDFAARQNIAPLERGNNIMISKIIALLKKVKREKNPSQQTSEEEKPVIASAQTFVVKKVHRNE